MKIRKAVWMLLVLCLLTGAATSTGVARGIDSADGRRALLYGGLVRESRASEPAGPVDLAVPAATVVVTGTVAFSSDRAGTADLYTQPAGGGGADLLEGGPGSEAAPVWSPDGAWLAFASDRDGDMEIFLRDSDGQVSQLTDNDRDDIHPSWSPDGDRVLFSSDRGGATFDIYSMDLSGGDVRQLTAVSGQNLVFPRWSPTGAQIAYMQSSILTPLCSWNWDIWLMAPDGSGRYRLTTQLGADLYPNWSPDGSRVLYSSCRAPYLTSDLYAEVVATGVETRLTASLTVNEWNGVYAPDGLYIAYNSDVTGDEEILIMSAAGGAATNLTQNGAVDLAPSWAGGEATTAYCDAATAPVPLLFITGWSGSEDNEVLSDDGQLQFFDELLARHGYREGCNLFYATGTTPTQSLFANGSIIAGEVCRIGAEIRGLDRAWNGSLDIVGHSYGGLRARAFLENSLLYSGDSGIDCDGGPIRVQNLFTLGTPHMGEYPDLPLSFGIGLAAVISQDEWPAIYEMLPPVRLWQTLTSRQPRGTCYHLVGGDARLQAVRFNTLLRAIYHLWTPAQLEANDLAVHYESATGLLAFAPLYPAVAGTPTIDVHGHLPWFFNSSPSLRSYVFPSTTFDQAVEPFVGAAGCAAAESMVNERAGPAPAALLAGQREPRQTAQLPLMEIAEGMLMAGEVLTGTFELWEPGQMQVSLVWPEGDIALALADPAGQSLTDADAHVRSVSLDTGYGVMHTYVVTQTLSGTYHYTATAGTAQDPVGYRLTVRPPAPIALRASMAEWQPFAAPVVMTATVGVTSPGTLSDVSISGTVTDPAGVMSAITLYDDGQHQDGAPGDGIFGWVFTATEVGGMYSVQLDAAGAYDGVPFSRTADTFFFTGSADAALTAQYDDAAVDDDGDDFYEALMVTTTVNVNVPSTYTLSAELYAGEHFVAHAARTALLAAGSAPVELRFDGVTIGEVGLDGPYTVRHVLLTSEVHGTLLLETADNVHQTDFYRASDFGGPNRILLPILRR